MTLVGTLPVLPFDPNQTTSYGDIHGGSGQPPKVLALATDEAGGVILLHLVGYKTACSSHGARLMMNGKLLFTPSGTEIWVGETMLARLGESHYQELTTPLPSLRMVDYLTLTRAAHLTQGMQTPPVFPKPEKEVAKAVDSTITGEEQDEQGEEDDAEETVDEAQSENARLDLSKALPRFIFGNVGEETPARKTVDHVLAALRVARYRDSRTPSTQALSDAWVDVLWAAGQDASLIMPMPAIGIKAWRVSGNLNMWADLVFDNLTSGRLPQPIGKE